MRYRLLGTMLAACLAFGCAASDSKSNVSAADGNAIANNQIPAGVQAAFASEHPYGTIQNPREISDNNGPTAYVIPYTRPDGTKGTVTYSPSGVLLSDKQ
jgi:hypothetical protein